LTKIWHADASSLILRTLPANKISRFQKSEMMALIETMRLSCTVYKLFIESGQF